MSTTGAVLATLDYTFECLAEIGNGLLLPQDIIRIEEAFGVKRLTWDEIEDPITRLVEADEDEQYDSWHDSWIEAGYL